MLTYNTDTMTKRQAIAQAREAANALIDQLERIARGFDKGVYRDDDSGLRFMTVQQTVRFHVMSAFEAAYMFKGR